MAVLSRYDVVLCRRTIALALVLAVLVVFVASATDEHDTTWAARLARVAALLPVAGGLAAYLASDQARSRGEVRAHASLGVGSAKATAGSWLGGTLVSALGAGALCSERLDLRSLFPRAVAFHDTWSHRADGWFEATRGLLVGASGELTHLAATVDPAPTQAAVPRAATFVAVSIASLALPLWGAAPASVLRRAGVILALAGASVAVFHLVAAGRTWDGLLAVPPALLLADAWQLHRTPAWS